ncbi:unnamed protein product [Acanthoscelides obtectus]|uniref:Protein Wnt n=3 Tax=Acanthoscelides obtectus TaxID=200917 RepID=A0A9P0JSD5_ACAOB|nr:unnamed protein product [Acanthoscelides obtectus]CAK1679335.1 Protein Wnt-7b [Acanthoscelides obtectus]
MLGFIFRQSIGGHAGSHGSMSPVYDLGTEVVCSNSPWLLPKQRDLCRQLPDAMVAAADGARLAATECRRQFRHHRWNCTGTAAMSEADAFGHHVVIVGSREAAFTYAIASAGVAYAVAAACARGNVSACGCEPTSAVGAVPVGAGHRGSRFGTPPPMQHGWKWAGCSVDVGYGVRFARKFLDAREIEADERSLMNLHNNKAGRKAVKQNLIVECKCHGVSGSCTMKTCWKSLPPFRQIGDNLMKKYYRARAVSVRSTPQLGPRDTNSFPRKSRKMHLVLLKGRTVLKKPPKKSDLVYLQLSPNYCERDLAAGSLGTFGRSCNRTSRGIDGCDMMCCGRGYNTHQYMKTFQCRCKFHWCCKVECETCNERTEEYTCK